jgi:hypothetical protein
LKQALPRDFVRIADALTAHQHFFSFERQTNYSNAMAQGPWESVVPG